MSSYSSYLFPAQTNSYPQIQPIPLPTRISRYRLSPQEVPVDFFADPDGQWEFATLVEMAGFNPEHPGASVGALTQAFDGYPEGSAVITEVGTECHYVAIAQLPSAASVATARAPSPAARVSLSSAQTNPATRPSTSSPTNSGANNFAPRSPRAA